MESSPDYAAAGANDYFARREALRRRVGEAARALTDRGIAPTVTRVRAALGGGSPNDLAPALKEWKESFGSAESPADRLETPAIPVPISDVMHELWRRATVAAAVELKGGPTMRTLTMRTEEAEALRHEITMLRDQLEREAVMYGELRAQAARHEAIAREALARVEASEARERKHLRDLGGARQRIAELEATVAQRRERPTRPFESTPRRSQATTPRKSPRPPRAAKRRARRPAAKVRGARTARLAARPKKPGRGNPKRRTRR